jgi:uncharacterized membrane protein
MRIQSGAVRPWTCLSEGWQLIKDDYWLFLGIAFVGIFIAQIVPFAILVGPAMCGIHICMLRRERGIPVRFELLFDGFHYFFNSLIATLIIAVPEVIIGVLIWLMMHVAAAGFVIFVVGPNPPNPNAPQLPDPEVGIAMMVGGAAAIAILIVLAILVQVFTFFTYPLIVDKELSGWDAIRVSCWAARANFGGLVGVVLLQIALSLVGVALCCIGGFFIVPLDLAIVAIAYRHVFPFEESRDMLPDDEAPDDDVPAKKLPASSEGITATSPGAVIPKR